MSEITIRNSIQASLQGLVSRGIKACRKDDDGHLIFTLTDNSEVDIGKVDGDDGVSITGISTQTTVVSGAPNIITITLSNGTTSTFNIRNGVPGHTPVKGTDYFTAAEISQIETDVRNSITIPTKTSDLTNDSLYISEGGDISDLSNDVGYLTSETDPVFSASPANTIAYSDINTWNGKYTKPNSGIPKTDLETSVQTSLGKADTALQTETDPTVPSWAKQTNKPSYEANEITYGDSNIGAAIGDIEEEIGNLNEDLNELIDIRDSTNLYDNSIAVDGKLILYTGNAPFAAYANSILSGLVSVEEGKTYTVSNGPDNNYAMGAVCFFSDENTIVCGRDGSNNQYGSRPRCDGFVDFIRWRTSAYDGNSFKILEGSNIKYVCWYICKGTGNYYGTHNGLNGIIDHVQMNEGDTLLPFDEYGSIRVPKFVDADAVLKEELGTKIDNIKSNNVNLIINGENLYFSSEVEDDNVIGITAVKNKATENGSFNFAYITKNSSTIKFANDDIAPLQLVIPNTSGGYIGGNHGFANGRRLSANHDKNNVDIGSIWKDANNNEFVIFGVNNGSVDVVSPTQTNVTSPLTHVNGATHISDIVFTNVAMQQMYPAINRRNILVLDENGNELSDGKYKGRYFDVVESYNIINPLAAINFIKSHTGQNTNTSIGDDSIEGHCRINAVYRFNKGCAVTVYYTIDSINDVTYSYDGMLQCSTIGDYCYVPNYNNNNVFVLGSETVELYKTNWVDQTKVPFRYYQFNSSNYDIGVMLGYYPKVADAVNETRLNLISSSCGCYYSTTHKMYPYFIHARTIESDKSLEAICFYTPFLKSDNGSLATTYNYVGNDVILCLDYHNAVDTVITLRDECVGKQIEVIDKTDSCIFNRKLASSEKLPIKFTDKGYVVLRFYN